MSAAGGVITAAVKHLIAAGVTGEALLAAIAEMEASNSAKDASAERRRARDRAYQAAKRIRRQAELPLSVDMQGGEGANESADSADSADSSESADSAAAEQKEIPPDPHKKKHTYPTEADASVAPRGRMDSGPTEADVSVAPRGRIDSGPTEADVSVAPEGEKDASVSVARKARTERASRLPDDFQVPEEWIDWAVAKRRWLRSEAREEAEGFCRYWQARAGAGARKRDWLKTWQNWAMNSRRKDGAGAGASAAPGARAGPKTAAELLRAADYRASVGDHERAAQYRAEAEAARKTGPPPGLSTPRIGGRFQGRGAGHGG